MERQRDPEDSTPWVDQLVELAGQARQATDPVERADLVARLQRASGWALRTAVREVRDAGTSWRELAEYMDVPFATLHRQFQAGGGLHLVRPGSDTEPPPLSANGARQLSANGARQLSANGARQLSANGAGPHSANGAGRHSAHGAPRPEPAPDHDTAPPSVGAASVPAALDSFVGREKELARTIRLLTRRRLLTITGPAGAGKTRLSVEVTGRVRPAFPDGAWVVELAAVSEPALVTQTLAAAVGVRERRGEPLMETLVAALRQRRSLIVVDNCEHLVQVAGGVLGELLRRCPDLRAIATSREALQIPGEVIVALPPMPVPAAGDPADRSSLLRSDAVRLFVEWAKASAPDFELTDANAGAVATICARLDGLPLAIELATRRLRTFTAEQLLTYLDDRRHLLAMPGRTAAGRQQSLREAIRWSHELLDEPERAVLRRLAVLAGGFDVDTATAVCADDDLDAGAVVDALAGLENKSLLVSAGPGRLRQLESIRVFAQEQLAAAGEVDATNDRLVGYLSRLVAPLTDDLTVAQELWESLGRVRDCMLPAVEWAIGAADARQVLVAVCLAKLWRRDGYPTQAARLVDRVLACGSAPAAHHAMALCEASYLAMRQGDIASALRLANRAVATGRQQPNPTVLARTLQLEALVLSESGDCATAFTRLREQLALIRPTLTPVPLSSCLNNVAWVALEAGRLAEAEAPLAEAMAILETHGEPADRVETLHSVGTLALLRGDLDGAEEYYRAALRLNNQDMEDPAFNLEGLAIVATRRAEPERALRLVGAATALRTRVGLQNSGWWHARVVEATDAASAALPPSRVRAALAAGERYTIDQASALALRTCDGGHDPEAPLTPREQQVAALVAQGLTNAQIARRLSIAERTAVSHLERIRAKLGLASRAQIALMAAEQKLAP